MLEQLKNSKNIFYVQKIIIKAFLICSIIQLLDYIFKKFFKIVDTCIQKIRIKLK